MALTDFLTFELPFPIHQKGDFVGRQPRSSAWDETQGEDNFQLQELRLTAGKRSSWSYCLADLHSGLEHLQHRLHNA